MKRIFCTQYDNFDCGPACMVMIAAYYGKLYSIQHIREECFLTREGVSLLGIQQAAENIGFDQVAIKLTAAKLINQKDRLPAILYWNQNHFVVLRNIKKQGCIAWGLRRLLSQFLKPGVHGGSRGYIFKIADPAHSEINISEEKFRKHWIGDQAKGIALFLQPTEEFYKKEAVKEKRGNFTYLLQYLKSYSRSLLGIISLLIVGSLFTLALPILTQKLIDEGVEERDLGFIKLILLAQLSLYIGSLSVEMFRNWLMLKVGTRINIEIISDFLKKLLRLPIGFFDTKIMGDFNQRISDHERIESFMTSQSLLTFFSMITFLVFFGVLWHYSSLILGVYLGISLLAVSWSLIWMRRRKALDYSRFQQRSLNQQSIYEIINGVSEMKLNQFEDFKRKEWEHIQNKLFKINLRILKVDQLQLSGFEMLNQVKNIFVTFLAASLVVSGNMTLGSLLSVSYIIGQMNSPINQLMTFLRSLQDARLSLDRLQEVQSHKEEEEIGLLEDGPKLEYEANEKLITLNDVTRKIKNDGYAAIENVDYSSAIDQNRPVGFKIEALSFQYQGPNSPYVLKDVTFEIPLHKKTAIVGSSGSGKTTLLKLLLKFYVPSSGSILLEDRNLDRISHLWLRKNSGVVMQDGYIFADTIERNIICGDELPDEDRLMNAVEVANLSGFLNSLPLGLKTKVGSTGNGISGGQKQRILIARAVYKNPKFLFFDEATSSLDAENEKIIHNNLSNFFKGRTVLIIAHRLSTVRNVDNIIVLKHGKIVEQGNHRTLIANKANYYNLVKDQLELGD